MASAMPLALTTVRNLQLREENPHPVQTLSHVGMARRVRQPDMLGRPERLAWNRHHMRLMQQPLRQLHRRRLGA